MAIFPIVKGQKPDPTKVIPPPSSDPAVAKQPQADHSEDLIDFGQHDEPSNDTMPPEPGKAKENPTNSAEDGGEVEDMLRATGTPAPSGPLTDFHRDMKKSVPELNREDTEGEFYDAQE